MTNACSNVIFYVNICSNHVFAFCTFREERLFNMKKNKFKLLIIPTLVLVCCFFFFAPSKVSAGAGSLNDIVDVESVLIKRGDTLSSIAEEYAPTMSFSTSEVYLQDIIELNNLDSQHIKAGSYILLPKYR